MLSKQLNLFPQTLLTKFWHMKKEKTCLVDLITISTFHVFFFYDFVPETHVNFYNEALINFLVCHIQDVLTMTSSRKFWWCSEAVPNSYYLKCFFLSNRRSDFPYLNWKPKCIPVTIPSFIYCFCHMCALTYSCIDITTIATRCDLKFNDSVQPT